MSNPNLTALWSTLSHKVLSSILVDHGAIFPVKDVLKHNYQWFPGKDGWIWTTALQCVDANVPPTLEAILSRLNGKLDPG